MDDKELRKLAEDRAFAHRKKEEGPCGYVHSQAVNWNNGLTYDQKLGYMAYLGYYYGFMAGFKEAKNVKRRTQKCQTNVTKMQSNS